MPKNLNAECANTGRRSEVANLVHLRQHFAGLNLT